MLAARRRRRLTAEPDRSRERLHHVGDQAQQCRLAATARPDDRAELAGTKVKVHLVQGDHRLATAIKNHGGPINADMF
jgi:hypothetical protein